MEPELYDDELFPTDEDIIEMFHKGGAWGLETLIDLQGCNPDTIRDKEKIEEFVELLADLIDMKRFGDPVIVHFGADSRVAGYSLTQLIETSLISGHFANETNEAFINIFSCKEYKPQVAVGFCRLFFGASAVNCEILYRGGWR